MRPTAPRNSASSAGRYAVARRVRRRLLARVCLGEYPHEFVDELAAAGWLGVLVSEAYDDFGVAREYDVERYFREARLTRIAPVT